MGKRILWTVLCWLVSSLAAGQTMHKAAYGEKVKFEWFVPLEFPDFRLVLQGEQHVEGTRQPGNRPFSEDYISVHIAGADVVNLRWMVQPPQKGSLLFELGGKRYRLEMNHSAIMGRLERDELVVWVLK